MKKTLLSLFALIALLSCATQPAQKPVFTSVSFRGEDLLDRSSGLLLRAEKKTILAVFSAIDGYFFVLPYFDKWDFTIERGSKMMKLLGQSEPFNVTLLMEAYDISPEKQLEYVLNQLHPDKYQMLNVMDQKVLRTEINAERLDKSFKGGKHINYYCARRREELIFTLHISVMSFPYDFADERKLLICTESFSVDSGLLLKGK